MPIYNRGDDAWLRTGVASRIDYGYILPRADINSAQIGTGGATWLWCNLRIELVHLILEQQTNICHVCAELRINDNRALFYNGKMCERTQITYRKV